MIKIIKRIKNSPAPAIEAQIHQVLLSLLLFVTISCWKPEIVICPKSTDGRYAPLTCPLLLISFTLTIIVPVLSSTDTILISKSLGSIFDVLPDKINSCLKDKSNLNKLQEIRVKVGKPLNIVLDNTETIFNYVITREDVKAIIQKISNYSLYAFEEDIRQGYITIQGGHRVGLAGQCVIEDNSIKTIRNITSLNIRVCREIVGCSNSLMNSLVENNRVNNTLIISPPKCGKTTLLRDITRNISNGISQIGFKGKRTVVIDERSEIAACYNGIPQMNVGMRTDVYDNCIKSEGMMMAVRGLSPEVIICDEIGTYKDMEGLMMAYNSGVSIIATLHGRNVEELYRRPVFREIVENNIINKVVVLSGKKGIGTIEGIYNV